MPVKGLGGRPSRSTSWSGAGPVRSRLQAAAAARGLTRFVGRDARAGAAPPGARARGGRARPGRGDRRRAGRGQVAARLGGHPLPSHARLARRSQAGSVSYGKATPYLPVIDLLKALLPDRGARRPATDPREGDGQAPRRSTGAWSRACPPSWRCSTCRSTTRRGRRSTRRSGASGRSRRSSGCCSARARCSRCSWSFEDLHWIDSETQALLDSLVESLPDRPRPAPRQLPPRVPARLGEQDLLHASSGSTRCRPRARRSCSQALLGDDAEPAAAQAAPDRADRRATRSSWRRASGRWSRPGCWSASAAPTACRRRRPSIQVPATVQAILAARIDRLPARGEAPAPDRVGHRHGRAVRPAPGRRRPAGGGAAPRPRPPPGRRVPLRDARSSPTSSTRSSTRSPTRWPTAACSRTGGARSTPASSRPSSGSTPSALAEQVERLAHHALRGRAVGEGGRLSPPGGAPGHGAGRQPRGRRPPRAGARGARAISPRPGRRPS